MGFLTGGLFYDMIGKTGNNVGRRVNGRNVVSMAPAKGNRTPTAAQLVQQLKLTLVTGWLSEISDFIRVGFEDHGPNMSAWNAAVQYNVKRAVSGTAPNFTINYAEALFSRGKLAKAKSAVVVVTEDAQLDFTWSPLIASYKKGAATDQAGLVVYNPAKQEWDVSVGSADRADAAYDLMLPSDWSGDVVQSWMLFVSGKEVSDSVYVGSATVQ